MWLCKRLFIGITSCCEVVAKVLSLEATSALEAWCELEQWSGLCFITVSPNFGYRRAPSLHFFIMLSLSQKDLFHIVFEHSQYLKPIKAT